MSKTDWSPENTLVLILGYGLSEWDEPEHPGWERPSALANVFRQMGVPKEQLLVWDENEGHPTKFRKKLPRFLQNSDEDTLFIFYYAGHGWYDAEDDFYFCHPTDDDGSISREELFEIIEDNFEGYQILLTADCCQAGALAREIKSRETDYGYAALTSSTKDVVSYGWTFSDCLIGALRGDSVIDADGNGTISFQELADHILRRMRAENQPADYEHNEGFLPSFRLAIARPSGS